MVVFLISEVHRHKDFEGSKAAVHITSGLLCTEVRSVAKRLHVDNKVSCGSEFLCVVQHRETKKKKKKKIVRRSTRKRLLLL